MTQTINNRTTPYRFNSATTSLTELSGYRVHWVIENDIEVKPDSVSVVSATDLENLRQWRAETLAWAESFAEDLPEENPE